MRVPRRFLICRIIVQAIVVVADVIPERHPPVLIARRLLHPLGDAAG
jgi:hypothetical protein